MRHVRSFYQTGTAVDQARVLTGPCAVQAAAQHKALLERKRKELADFQTKWKIRVKASGARDEDESTAMAGTGVLVEKS